MTMIEFLATAAVGSFLGVLAKELFDLAKVRNSHRLGLRAKYFDEKLAHTLAAVKMLKTVTTLARELGHDTNRALSRIDTTSLHAQAEDRGGLTDIANGLVILSSFTAATEHCSQRFEEVTKQLATVAEVDAATRSSLGFFYGERWESAWQRFEGHLESATDKLETLTNAFSATSARLANAEPESVIREIPAMIGILVVAASQFAITARSLDSAADKAIEIMRYDFRSVEF